MECRRAGLDFPCWMILDEYNRVDLDKAFDFESTASIGALSHAFLKTVAAAIRQAAASRPYPASIAPDDPAPTASLTMSGVRVRIWRASDISGLVRDQDMRGRKRESRRARLRGQRVREASAALFSPAMSEFRRQRCDRWGSRSAVVRREPGPVPTMAATPVDFRPPRTDATTGIPPVPMIGAPRPVLDVWV